MSSVKPENNQHFHRIRCLSRKQYYKGVEQYKLSDVIFLVTLNNMHQSFDISIRENKH